MISHVYCIEVDVFGFLDFGYIFIVKQFMK